MMNSQQLHPHIAQKILAGEIDRQLYRVVLLAKVFPDATDISTVALGRFMVHMFADDADDARKQLKDDWQRNMDDMELLRVLAVAPVPGESIEEGSIWKTAIMRVVS